MKGQVKGKIEPRLIDIKYLDRELYRLFNSIPWGKGDDLFTKYRSRFLKEQRERDKPTFIETQNNTLSIAKKLEILCTYGNHRIVKIDKKS